MFGNPSTGSPTEAHIHYLHHTNIPTFGSLAEAFPEAARDAKAEAEAKRTRNRMYGQAYRVRRSDLLMKKKENPEDISELSPAKRVSGTDADECHIFEKDMGYDVTLEESGVAGKDASSDEDVKVFQT